MAYGGANLYNAFFESVYGQGVDLGALASRYIGLASGSVPGGNPPYTLNDFLAVYPKFFGTPTPFTGDLAAGSAEVANASTVAGMAVGQLVAGAGVPPGALIQSVGDSSVMLTQPVASSANAANLIAYQSPFAPLLVVQMFINLAHSSLVIARWFDMWPLAMALYVAHYLTLWMQTETGANSTAAQVVASGLQQGILVSQAAGDVSASTEPVAGFDDWGSLALTQYGVQLATFAKSIGSGPIYVGSGVGRSFQF